MGILKQNKNILFALALIIAFGFYIMQSRSPQVDSPSFSKTCAYTTIENVNIIFSNINKDVLNNEFMVIIRDSLNFEMYKYKDTLTLISSNNANYRALCRINKSFHSSYSLEIQLGTKSFLLNKFEVTPRLVQNGISSFGLNGCKLNKLKINNITCFYKDDMVVINE